MQKKKKENTNMIKTLSGLIIRNTGEYLNLEQQLFAMLVFYNLRIKLKKIKKNDEDNINNIILKY